MKYKLSYNVIKTQDDLKKIYPFIIEDIKKMKFVTAIASYRHGYNYRNENEALVVFRKVYTDYTRYGKIHNPKSQSVRGYDGVFPTLRWVLSAWLRRLYLVSGMLATDQEYNERILELFQLSNYLEVNKDEIYKM